MRVASIQTALIRQEITHVNVKTVSKEILLMGYVFIHYIYTIMIVTQKKEKMLNFKKYIFFCFQVR